MRRAPSPEVLRAKLEVAFGRLRVHPVRAGRIPAATAGLVALAMAKPSIRRPTSAVAAGADSPAFRHIGLQRCRDELHRLRKAAEDGDLDVARTLLRAVHAPTIDSLARAGFVRPAPLSRKHLPLLAAATRRARPRGRHRQGRQPSAEDRFAARIADILAGLYHQLTGEHPTIAVRPIADDSGPPHRPGRPPHRLRKPVREAYGNFLRFVMDVFDAIGLKRNAVAAARDACARFRTATTRFPAGAKLGILRRIRRAS
jgi:hypothetical protein